MPRSFLWFLTKTRAQKAGPVFIRPRFDYLAIRDYSSFSALVCAMMSEIICAGTMS